MNKINNNKEHISNIFFGNEKFAIICHPGASFKSDEQGYINWSKGDLACCDEKDFQYFIDTKFAIYDRMLEWHNKLNDHSVPFIDAYTGTEIFACAFGADLHIFEPNKQGDTTPPCAIANISTSEDAKKIEIPSLNNKYFERLFRAGNIFKEKLGDNVPIGVCDMQSPFDVASLIWNKQDLFFALIDEPEAVLDLTEKTYEFIRTFLNAWKKEFPCYNFCHCPPMWTPDEVGCSFSEDEIGMLNNEMFNKFYIPFLDRLSHEFGGITLHCCASADHQYSEFKKIHNLHGINRVFQEFGPKPAIEAFAGHCVMLNCWLGINDIKDYLEMSSSENKHVFIVTPSSLEEAKIITDKALELFEKYK